MATSGSYLKNYNVTAYDILYEALGIVGVYDPGEAIPASETTDALRTLNMMLKGWQSRYFLWKNKELALFFQEDENSYDIGPTGDHCADSWAKTEVATAAASGASSVVVDATTGFGDTFDRNGIVTATTPAVAGAITLTGALVTSGIATLSGQRKILIYSDADDSGVSFGITGLDALGASVTETITGPNTTTVYSTYTYKSVSAITIDGAGTGNIEIGQVGDPVGIELDGDSIHWTYLSAALSTTLSLVTALTDAVAVDNHVYSYTVKTQRPYEIVEARVYGSDNLDRSINIISRADYMGLSDKTSEGTPNQVYYDKQLSNGKMYIWPEPNNMQEYLKFTARIPIMDLNELTEDLEMAGEWFEAVSWNLALRLFPKYGKPIDQSVALMALSFLEDAVASDSENTSTFIGLSRYGRR